jgi:hypothetical protein
MKRWLPCVSALPLCACAALMLRAVCMHWGRPPAELCAGVRWAELAWRFGCVGALMTKPLGNNGRIPRMAQKHLRSKGSAWFTALHDKYRNENI